jgi:hypothetical protein
MVIGNKNIHFNTPEETEYMTLILIPPPENGTNCNCPPVNRPRSVMILIPDVFFPAVPKISEERIPFPLSSI